MTTATATAPAGTAGRIVTVTTADGAVWTGVRKNATHGWVRTFPADHPHLPGFRDFGFSATAKGAAQQAARLGGPRVVVETFVITNS